jgi:hypothetical protein
VILQRSEDALRTFRLVLQEMRDLAFCSVRRNDCEALVVHVENEILALVMAIGPNYTEFILRKRTMTARPMRPMSPL